MELIQPDDPQYFTETSDGDYGRHQYKVVSKTGESIVVDDYMLAQEIWWTRGRGKFISHIEVLDKKPNIKKKSKGFS